MGSSASRTVLMAVGALALVVVSFFGTLKLMDYWGGGGRPPQLREPAYEAASLPHVSPGQTLDFSHGQNRGALLSGWSVPEPQGVFSVGHAAYLGFVVDGKAAPKQVIIRGLAYFAKGKLDEQRVQVWLGGKRLASFNLKDPTAILTVPLADTGISPGTPILLGLYLPDAKSPLELGLSIDDSRALGIYLQALQLTP